MSFVVKGRPGPDDGAYHPIRDLAWTAAAMSSWRHLPAEAKPFATKAEARKPMRRLPSHYRAELEEFPEPAAGAPARSPAS